MSVLGLSDDALKVTHLSTQFLFYDIVGLGNLPPQLCMLRYSAELEREASGAGMGTSGDAVRIRCGCGCGGRCDVGASTSAGV